MVPHDFNWQIYVDNYDDLKLSVSDEKNAIEHWNKYGKKEHRVYKYSLYDYDDDFDWYQYVNNYDDLKKSGIDSKFKAWQHWNEYGKKEGRTYKESFTGDSFDWESYIDDNDDLKQVLKTKTDAKEHWEKHGKKEKREYKKKQNKNPIPLTFDWNKYIDENNLKDTKINTRKKAYYHSKFHYYKKKIPSDFDWKKYVQINNLKINNEIDSINHYLDKGVPNKLMYKYDVPSCFSWKMYIKLNKDLSFDNENDAALHYINYGKHEKRKYKCTHVPDDFSHETYIELNDDLKHMNKIDANLHYEEFGYYEKRHYKYKNIPEDFYWKSYVELNPDLKFDDEIGAKVHYEKYGSHERRKYKYKHVPNDFDWNVYIELNYDLESMSEIDAKMHYENFGHDEKRQYKYKTASTISGNKLSYKECGYLIHNHDLIIKFNKGEKIEFYKNNKLYDYKTSVYFDFDKYALAHKISVDDSPFHLINNNFMCPLLKQKSKSLLTSGVAHKNKLINEIIILYQVYCDTDKDINDITKLNKIINGRYKIIILCCGNVDVINKLKNIFDEVYVYYNTGRDLGNLLNYLKDTQILYERYVYLNSTIFVKNNTIKIIDDIINKLDTYDYIGTMNYITGNGKNITHINTSFIGFTNSCVITWIKYYLWYYIMLMPSYTSRYVALELEWMMTHVLKINNYKIYDMIAQVQLNNKAFDIHKNYYFNKGLVTQDVLKHENILMNESIIKECLEDNGRINMVFISHNNNFLSEGAPKFIKELHDNMKCNKCLLVNNDHIVDEIKKNTYRWIIKEIKSKYTTLLKTLKTDNELFEWFFKLNKKSNIIIYFNTLVLLPLVKQLTNHYVCVLVVHENEVDKYINEKSMWNGDTKAFVNDLHYCDKIIFVCEQTQQTYKKYSHTDNCVIYNGITMPNTNKKYDNVSSLRICMIGTICNRKNQLGLIKYLNKKKLPYVVDLYGNYGDVNETDFLGLSNYNYKGVFNNTYVNDIFKDYDVLISNSYHECLPYNIIEGMSNGVVAVSSLCGGVSEIITDKVDGFTYKIDDYKKLCDIIQNLDKKRDTLKLIGTNAIDKIKNKFNLSKSIGIHLDMCQELLYEHDLYKIRYKNVNSDNYDMIITVHSVEFVQSLKIINNVKKKFSNRKTLYIMTCIKINENLDLSTLFDNDIMVVHYLCNKGADIGGFLCALRLYYKFNISTSMFLKLHSKGETSGQTHQNIFNMSKDIINKYDFEKHNKKCMVASTFCKEVHNIDSASSVNFPLMKFLCNCFNIDDKLLESQHDIIIYSIFHISSDIIDDIFKNKNILSLIHQMNTYNHNSPRDGLLEHAYERIFSFMCMSCGGKIYFV